MRNAADIFGAISGLIFAGGLLLGWGLISATILPPLSPNSSPEAVTQFYQDGSSRIQFGMMITMATLAFLVPFGSALATQMRRMADGHATLANAQFGCTVLTAGVVTMGMTLWSITSFRPDRGVELTYLLNDMAWIAFTLPVSGIMLMMFVTGLAIITDKSPEPIFPRWSAYFCFWGATLTAPGFGVVLFKSGPFAWNGLFAFWIALAIAFAWIIVIATLIIRAVRIQTARQSP